VNSLPKTATRQCRDCDSNPCSSEPESGTLTTRLPSHPYGKGYEKRILKNMINDIRSPGVGSGPTFNFSDPLVSP